MDSVRLTCTLQAPKPLTSINESPFNQGEIAGSGFVRHFFLTTVRLNLEDIVLRCVVIQVIYLYNIFLIIVFARSFFSHIFIRHMI